MIGDLDLAWEEQNEPRRGQGRRGGPPTRQARQRRRKDRKRRRRSFGALFISFLMLAALGGGVYWGVGKIQERFTAADYTQVGTEQVTIEVKAGQSATDIANTLYAAGVVKSAKAFVNAANADSRSKTIQPGSYTLYKPMPARDALIMMIDPENKITKRVTIPEGRTAIQTFKLLSKGTGIPEKDFVAAAKDPAALGVPEWWFKRSDNKPVVKSIEGFLYPDTYEFGPNDKAPDVLKKMVDQFNTIVGEMDFANRVQKEREIAPYEALIVASLAQAEAGNKEDLGKIARVAYNRVYTGTFDCGCLQFDVTVNYWLELQGKPTKSSAQMTTAELNDPRNPYNTGDKSPGLPRGPIDSPGKDALQGAMDPPKGPWLYFVAIDKEGHSKFATTLAEHDANRQEACRNGIITC